MLYCWFNWPAWSFGGILMTPADKRLDSRSSMFFWLRLFSGGGTCGSLMMPADKSLNNRSSTFTCGASETWARNYKWALPYCHNGIREGGGAYSGVWQALVLDTGLAGWMAPRLPDGQRWQSHYSQSGMTDWCKIGCSPAVLGWSWGSVGG